MPKQLPFVGYNEVNQSQVPPVTLLGAHGLITETLFGQDDKPYEINTVQQFLDTFGGAGAASPYFAQIVRALRRGVTLFIQRLVSTGALAATITLDTSHITVTAVDKGSFANGTLAVSYTPLAAGNGTATLNITYRLNNRLNESFSAKSLDELIAAVNAGSSLVTITTANGYVEPADSSAAPVYLAGGTDGAFATTAARDAAIAALFTKFDDSTAFPITGALAAMGAYSTAHFGNLTNYVQTRQDIMGVFEIDPTLTPDAATTFALTLAPNSSWVAVYYGSSLSAYDVNQNATLDGPILADVLAVWSVSDTIQGNVYAAPAGGRRGRIPNVKTFATNLLAPSKTLVANKLVAAGVNVVGSDATYGPVVWGAQTFAQSNTALDAINVRRSLLDIHATLLPIFRSEIFQAMDPVSWRDAYTKSKTILDNAVRNKAIYAGYVYTGDQEASTIADAKYNQPADLANGNYKVQISVVPVGYIYGITIELDVNNLTVLFNTNATVSN